MDPGDFVRHYHEETKHHFHRYARSLGYLDWDSQPDPFRRFHGAPLTPLALHGDRSEPAFDELFAAPLHPPSPVTLDSIGEFFELSLALSAWKQIKTAKWALRINPSSGNLHPTEGYLLTRALEGLHVRPGVYHYAPAVHSLERRAEFDPAVWDALVEGFPAGTFLVGLSSVLWREAWKYGERAYRYCQHDVGHALAALAISAAVQGWRAVPLCDLGDSEVSALLGLDRESDFDGAEREHPDLLLAIVTRAADRTMLPCGLSAAALKRIKEGSWAGKANALSSEHADWPIIDSVAETCLKPKNAASPLSSAEAGGIGDTPCGAIGGPMSTDRPPVSARRLIRQRRSAVAMDGRTSLSAEQFYLMLDRTLPRYDRALWSALGPPVCVHLAVFVHLVDGLAPGLYSLVRDPAQLDRLRGSMSPSFSWERPAGCPESLPLFELARGDLRRVAGEVSCHQEIAALGAFSVGMLAAFEEPLRRFGPWFYRRLFWETGAVGQVLYLEAEAAGLRGTGIGCFFDDAMHELLGLSGASYQSLYHFTLGGPVEDARLTTLPPYAERTS